MPLTSKPQNSAYKYQIGGSLQVDAPSYVERQADIDFYNGLKAGEFCYVLNSRQMGKSSLRVQTMRKLQADGIACGVIDITAIGSQDITPSEWYLGVLRRLVRSFTPKVKALTWWGDCSGLSPVQRLSEFIESVLLLEVSQNIVIFVDEIDSVVKLNFKDDFLALLRACYNKRADNPAYQRLTFALLGVATPYDLIQDKNRTPFNIGRAIELNGFHLSEAQPLAQGLVERVTNPQVVLKEVLAWTGGQPFLTQKLCQLVLTSSSPIPAGSEANSIENLVRSIVIENWESADEPEHLKTIRDRILKSEKHSFRLLGLYQQILLRSEITADGSPEQMELQLSGLVVKQQGLLRSYNRIYADVFNQSWIDKALSDLRPYKEALKAWVASDYQDESMLLRGQALRDAHAWAVGKSLSKQDYQFLVASQKLDTAGKTLSGILTSKRRLKTLLLLSTVVIVLVMGLWHLGILRSTEQSVEMRANYYTSNYTAAEQAFNEGTQLSKQETVESLRRAIEKYKNALQLWRVVGDPAWEAVTLVVIGKAYFDLGERQKALDYYNQALPLTLAVGEGEATTLNNIGLVYSDVGLGQQALKYFNRALLLSRTTGDRFAEGSILGNIGKVYDLLGERQKALDYYNQALPLLRYVGARRGEAATLTDIGNVYSAFGEQQRALENYKQALLLVHALTNRREEATMLRKIGKVYDLLGEKQKALDYYNQARVVTRK